MICPNCKENNAEWYNTIKFEKIGEIKLCETCYDILKGHRARRILERIEQ